MHLVHFYCGVFELRSGILFEWDFMSSVSFQLYHMHGRQRLSQLLKWVLLEYINHTQNVCKLFVDFIGVCFVQFFDCLH